MAIVVVVLFSVALLIGLTQGTLVIRKKNIPIPLAVVHGGFAFIGIAILTVTVFYQTSFEKSFVSLIIFIASAVAGFLMFVDHLLKRPWPKTLLILHFIFNITAYVILLTWAL
jgi:hypothetical protein